MAKRPANIYASMYDGTFDVGFDCSGETNCKFALCFLMPPTGDDPCSFHGGGTCNRIAARIAALELLRQRIGKEIKQLESEEE